VKRKVTVKLVFAGTQSVLAFCALIVALLMHFNILDAAMLNIPDGTQSLYALWLALFSVILLISGVFLIYEWWEAD
jgi:uncharacterized membrane protein